MVIRVVYGLKESGLKNNMEAFDNNVVEKLYDAFEILVRLKNEEFEKMPSNYQKRIDTICGKLDNLILNVVDYKN